MPRLALADNDGRTSSSTPSENPAISWTCGSQRNDVEVLCPRVFFFFYHLIVWPRLTRTNRLHLIDSETTRSESIKPEDFSASFPSLSRIETVLDRSPLFRWRLGRVVSDSTESLNYGWEKWGWSTHANKTKIWKELWKLNNIKYKFNELSKSHYSYKWGDLDAY